MFARCATFSLVVLFLVGSLCGCSGKGQGRPETKGQAGATEARIPGAGPSALPQAASLAGDVGQAAPDLEGSGRRHRYRGGDTRQPVEMSPGEYEKIGIKLAKASYRSVRSSHTAMGKVLAPQLRLARVSYAFPARVAAIHVQIGEWVEKGTPVLALQSEEVGRAESEFYKAIADLELAKANHEREKRLHSRGVGALKNAVTAGAAYKVAEATLNAAEKKLHVLGFSEEETKKIAETHQINPEITLVAPISGKIIEHKAVLGGMIDQTTELLTIMDPSVLWVDAEIFERDIAKIKVGQEASVSVPAYPGQSFRGRISYVSDLLNEATRSITVRTEVENKAGRLKPGMFANITIYLTEQQRVLAVPEDAVLEDGDDRIAFVLANGRYFPRSVTVGRRQDGFCEITSGLQMGDQVVTAGNFQLKSKLHADILKKSGVH